VVVTGSIIALMAGIYYWFPKMFGRKMNQTLGRVHFWGTIVLMNGVFFPMFIQGVAGVQRRLFDPTVQAHNVIVQPTNVFMTWCAVGLLLFQIPFIWNFFHSIFKGEKTEENPWQATTLEWACPSPPLPHRNFEQAPTVHRGPYEYSVPGAGRDFIPQNTP
jgi:cytochrome c oxidase subunit 1